MRETDNRDLNEVVKYLEDRVKALKEEWKIQNATIVKLRADLQMIREQQKNDYDRAEKAEIELATKDKKLQEIRAEFARNWRWRS